MRASETERSLVCPASLLLPRYENRYEKAELAAGFGTLIHHWKETGETSPKWASERDIGALQRKLERSGVRRETYWPAGWRHEVTFAIHLPTLKAKVYSGPRELADWWKKGAPPLEYLTGTIDGYLPASAPWGPRVDDLKTGHWLPDVATAKQLRSYALLPWVEDGCPLLWECEVSFTHWEKYPLAGEPEVYRHTLDGLDMQEHVELLRDAAAHPDRVVVVDTVCGRCGQEGHTAFKCDNEPVEGAVDKLSACTFCPCREEHPASAWMQNYKYARMPCCAPGLLTTIRRGA